MKKKFNKIVSPCISICQYDSENKCLGCMRTKDERIKNLMQSIDSTNYRYGRSTISLASAGINKKWSMRRQYSSKIDTADFYSLPKILAN